MMERKTEDEKRSGAERPEARKSSVDANGKLHRRGLRGRQGEETEEKEEEEEGGGKADGEEEVRGSSGVQLYNYPD